MVRRIPLAAAVLAFGLAALLFPVPAGLLADEAPTGAIALFNGKNFDGWRIYLDERVKDPPADTFTVKDGVIVCKGRPSGYLITEKDYANYVLTVEWRWPDKGGNSGVFVHVSGRDKIWPKGAEAQLMSGQAGDFWLVDGFKLKIDATRQDPDPRRARHFFRLGKDEKVEKPVGEWNKYEITCNGDTIKLVINGKTVNEGTGAEATKGKILLQSEGTPIEFRNVRLTPIK